MTRFERPRVAVIGAGDAGCGWSALAVAAGWLVTIYDADSPILQRAARDIADRVHRLVLLGRADQAVAEESLSLMRVGRSLLNAVNEADWIIEVTSQDLAAKQRLLEQVEQVSRLAAVVTSGGSGMHASDLCARLRRPERLMVAHAITPVELLPLVEVVPGPLTDPACVEDVRFWLGLLGRSPIIVRKEITGNVVGRIQAAMWRECIHLVLEGVLDADDMDTAVGLGPGLGWVAAGPHLTQCLGARDWNPDAVLSQALATFEELWSGLATWQKLTPEEQKRLIRSIEKVYAQRAPELRERRDQRLAALLTALSHS